MSWLSENRIENGLVRGLLTPLLAFAVLYGLTILIGMIVDPHSGVTQSPRTIRTFALVAICANVFWIRKYNQRLTQNTLRGVIIATMLLSVVWIVRYYGSLYG